MPSTVLQLPKLHHHLSTSCKATLKIFKYNNSKRYTLLEPLLSFSGGTYFRGLHHWQSIKSTMKFSKPMRPAWRIIQDSATNFLRAFGLHLIVSAFRSLRHLAIGKGYDEPTKIAIRKSRTTALMRALVHIVPVSVALWEIIFNWNTYYMGAVIRNQAYYQFGAKVHEMTAQASLAAIVFSYVRYEMSLGRGLPFGALFSGLQISQASYLWSMEFWGSICSKHLPVRRRVGMVLIVTVAIVLAATVGPSSAILLIPRLEYWPAGATNIWLNATSQDLWPDRSIIPLSYAVDLARAKFSQDKWYSCFNGLSDFESSAF